MLAGFENDTKTLEKLGSNEGATWWAGRCAADPAQRHPYVGRQAKGKPLYGAWEADVLAFRSERLAVTQSNPSTAVTPDSEDWSSADVTEEGVALLRKAAGDMARFAPDIEASTLAKSAFEGHCCTPRDGEPFFVLLGRDAQAPAAVEKWATAREHAKPGDDKIAGAREIAASMRAYRSGIIPTNPVADPFPAPVGVSEAPAAWQVLNAGGGIVDTQTTRSSAQGYILDGDGYTVVPLYRARTPASDAVQALEWIADQEKHLQYSAGYSNETARSIFTDIIRSSVARAKQALAKGGE